MLLRDRLTLSVSKKQTREYERWRWLAQPEDGSLIVSGVLVSGEVRSLSLTALEADQATIIETEGRRPPFQLRLVPREAEPPNAALAAAVRAAVAGMTDGGALFPLFSLGAELPDYTKLLDAITEAAPSLAAVCRRPRLELTTRESTEPLRRARRLGPRALSHLATRPETWEGRGISFPFPRRLMTTLPADEWNTYPNRFVRTVVRDCLAALDWAIADLVRSAGALEDAVRSLTDAQRENVRGAWARAQRICRLLGDRVDFSAVAARRAALASRLTELRAARDSLQGAQQTPLLRALASAPDERRLRPSAVLQNDASYRKAAVLRRQLQAFASGQDNPEIDDVQHRFGEWIGEALRRALVQLRFERRRAGWQSGRWTGRLTPVSETGGWWLGLAVGDGPPPAPPSVGRTRGSRQRGPRGAEDEDSHAYGLLVLPAWEAFENMSLETAAKLRIGVARTILVVPGQAGDRQPPLRPSDQLDVLVCDPYRLDSVEHFARHLLSLTWARDVTDGLAAPCPVCPEREPVAPGAECRACASRWYAGTDDRGPKVVVTHPSPARAAQHQAIPPPPAFSAEPETNNQGPQPRGG